MNTYHYIDRDIHQYRAGRIGASDIPALIPDPDKPNESLAGYGRTAVTVWEEKTGRRQRDPAGLAAEMGHFLEPKTTALFLRDVFGREYANEWLLSRMQFELLRRSDHTNVQASQYQRAPVAHNIEWYDDKFIVHPDAIYQPPPVAPDPMEVVAHGLQINLTKPFLIEAKSARYWSARRRDESQSAGYDMDLRTWQGIPLRHYVQIQFQLAMMDVDTCYLPLLYDTSQFQVWQIAADKSIQGKIIDLAGRLSWHIANDQPPKSMAMNGRDIAALYPTIDEDFVYLAGDEAEAVTDACRAYRKATAQEKVWKAKKSEAQDAIAVHLKDRGELRNADGGVLARWQERKGSERVTALGKIRTDDPVSYRYLKRKKLIEQSSGSRSPAVVWKEADE